MVNDHLVVSSESDLLFLEYRGFKVKRRRLKDRLNSDHSNRRDRSGIECGYIVGGTPPEMRGFAAVDELRSSNPKVLDHSVQWLLCGAT